MTNEITLSRNTNKTVQATVTSGGTAVDLTGAEIRLLVKRRMSDEDGDAEITKSSDDGDQITITDPTNGIFEVYFVPADTTSLSPGRHHYDIRIELSSGKQYVMPPGVGAFTVLDVVTETALS